jgi:hypothetical protein
VQLDETSRALLKKLLDDATRQALLKQANVICYRAITCKLRHLLSNFFYGVPYVPYNILQPLTAASDSVIPFSLGLTSPKKMDETASPSSSFLNNG